MEPHIVLLPRQHFWDWVQGVRDYVVKFRVNITPDPDNAGRYMAPGQTITVVLPPEGYPAYGDIQTYLRQKYPRARLDVIAARDPQHLKDLLAARIAANDRYGERLGRPDTAAPFRLHWPTDYPYITQPFGANPEIYARYNLPGHEGVDIRAPMGTPIYAAADGVVAQVHPDPADNHPYGIFLRIDHRDGYQTTYAHLQEILVTEGQHVRARDVIARADSTGNSTGAHLHLTLKKQGATASGLTSWPLDILDPTPFLVWPQEEPSAAAARFGWEPGVCLVGATVNPDGSVHAADVQAVQQARLEAVLLRQNTPSPAILRLRQTNPSLFLAATLTDNLSGEPVSPSAFVAHVQNDLARLYAEGVRYFEVQPEPNLQSNGWQRSWASGVEFGGWFGEVVKRLRQIAPDARFGFPGLSPGGTISGQRLDALTFLDQADVAAQGADWIGVRCFWQTRMALESPDGGRFHQAVRDRYPNHLLMITGFANLNPLTAFTIKGQEYVDFYRDLRQRAGYAAAFAETLSSSGPYQAVAWVSADGTLQPVVQAVGQREG